MPGRRYQLLLILLIAGCSYLPFSSSKSTTAPVQEDEETRISRQFRREARRQLNILSNPEVESYVDHVGRRILSVMGPLDFDYRFFVIGDPQLNAFSVPGGSIFVYTGLVERAKNTDEIAGVMGHEIIHAKNHHMQRMSGPDALSILGLLGMILARGGAAGQAAGAVGQALSATRQFAFSRGLELEADTLGTRYMAQAGYDPRGALSFMKTLDQQRAVSETEVPAYLLTHPVTQERVTNIELIIRSLSAQRPRPEGPDPLRRIQILIALDKHAEDGVVASYEKVLAAEPNNAEARHYLALGQQSQGKLAAARGNYEKARALDPRLPGIDRDLGRLYGQIGEFKLAHETFERALKIDARESLNYLYLGELCERENNLPDAANAYLSASNLAPFSAVVFNRLGLAYGRMNRQGEGYYYLGRSMLLMDDEEKAAADYERAVKILGPNSARGQVIKEEMEVVKSRRR